MNHDKKLQNCKNKLNNFFFQWASGYASKLILKINGENMTLIPNKNNFTSTGEVLLLKRTMYYCHRV